MPPPNTLAIELTKSWEHRNPHFAVAVGMGMSAQSQKSPGAVTHMDTAPQLRTPPPLPSTPVSAWSTPRTPAGSSPAGSSSGGGRKTAPSHSLPLPPSPFSSVAKEQQQQGDLASWFVSIPNVNTTTTGFRVQTNPVCGWSHGAASPSIAVDDGSIGNNAPTSSPSATSSTRADSPSLSVSSSSSESVRTNDFLNPHAPAFVPAPSGPTGVGTRPSIYEFAAKKAEEARLKAVKILQGSLKAPQDSSDEGSPGIPAAVAYSKDDSAVAAAAAQYALAYPYEGVDGYDARAGPEQEYAPWFYILRECASTIRLQPALARENLLTYAQTLVSSQSYQWSAEDMDELSLQICWAGIEAGTVVSEHDQQQQQQDAEEVAMLAMFVVEVYHAFVAVCGEQWAQEFLVRFRECVVGSFRNHWVSTNAQHVQIPYRLGLCTFMGYLTAYDILPAQSVGICLFLLSENTISSPSPVYAIRRIVSAAGPELWAKDDQAQSQGPGVAQGLTFGMKAGAVSAGSHEQRIRGWLAMLKKKAGAMVKSSAGAELERDVDGASVERAVEEIVRGVLGWTGSHGHVQAQAQGKSQHQHQQYQQLQQHQHHQQAIYQALPASGALMGLSKGGVRW